MVTAASESFCRRYGFVVGNASSGTATINVNNSGTLSTGTGTVVVNATGTINLAGGTFNLNGMVTNNGGHFNFLAGTLNVANDFAVGSGSLLDGTVRLGLSQTLHVAGTTTIEGGNTLVLDGGVFGTGSLQRAGVMDFRSGTFSLTRSELGVENGGLFGPQLVLPFGKNIDVTQAVSVASGSVVSLTGGRLSGGTISNSGLIALDGLTSELRGPVFNTGLIQGTGQIAGMLNNQSNGELRASAGQQLRVLINSVVNSGLISLLGGTFETAAMLNNAPTGRIVGRGTLNVGSSGLANQGEMTFSAGLTDVLGTVANQTGGKIIVTGGGTATFWNEVSHNGAEIRVREGCSAVFLRQVTGPGPFTGTGTKSFEGGYSPGNSPALVPFEGNVVFADTSRLTIELGGTTAGTQHDKLTVDGSLRLDGGELDVRLINDPYRPAHNDRFEILTFGTRTGDFGVKSGLELGGRLRLVPEYTEHGLTLNAAQGGSGSWRFDTSGNASISTNWNMAIPSAAGDVATLGEVLSDARTVTVDHATTLGGIIFSSRHPYTLGGAGAQTITLDNTPATAPAVIQVADTLGPDEHLISAPLSLTSNLLLQVNAGSLTISGPLDDSAGKDIIKVGAGTLIINGPQTWGVGSELHIGPVSGGGGQPGVVPEPATISLLGAGAVVWLVLRALRRKAD